ncbi:hypothetical protein SAMN05443543_101375 [Flavobacterium flevense]|uniref:Uncharacterized protein n=1 Tax=Flavobacterium flevense TaxID=983 RepID=A0A4Y4AW05_9FLAO|nr:hypothetical protein [Flavobacterium flevense]GEC71107.1 hypothetical protein FFL01_06460 [Flavobacterium flevense]SHL33328.1 hypothetical protein SAMN05443543_101375 [Flavobacterium flevense]
MEPNKLETQFREQLNSREIKPSEMAWTKLDAMLLATEKPKTKFPWLYVAASFTALFLIGTAYFNLKESPIQTQKNGIVIQHPVVPKSESILLDSTNLKIKEESFSNKKSVRMNNKLTDLRQKSKIAEKSVNQNQTAKISINDPYKKKDTMISSENNMSLAKNKYVSAEKLLAEISNTKFESADETMINTTKAVSVNPNILLSNVETELNQSFKESALNRLNKNFKTIRTVLVNRNYKD